VHVSRSVGLLVTCLLAGATVAVLVGPDVLLHPGRAVVGRNPANDFQVMTWSLDWWPWAIEHGANPLHTRLLWAPEGFSTLWMTTIPVPALLALPLTLTAGPLVAYNVLMLAAVVLAAAAAYLLCHELTANGAASILGGLVFALSPYMLGHTLSEHLDLTFVPSLPLLALAVVRHARGRWSRRRFVLTAAGLLLLELGSSFELFVDLSLVLAIVGGIAVAFARKERVAVMRAASGVATAYAVCLPVIAVVGLLAVSEPHAPVGHPPSDFAVDLLNVVVPTPTLLAGVPHVVRIASAHFVGNIGEQDGYIGAPLLAVSLLALRTGWRRGAWVAGVLLAVAVLLSLGPILTVGGRPIAALPFAPDRVPLLGDALPARLSIFAALAVAVLCALWFARPRRMLLQLAAAALVVASLLPNVRPAPSLPHAWATSTAFSWSTPRVPDAVADTRWKTFVPPGTNVLVLPSGDRTAASYWQASSGMRFALTTPATPFVPPQLAANPTVARLVDNVLPAVDGPALAAARLRALIRTDRVGVVVLAAHAGRPWRRAAERATGAHPVRLGDSLVYRVPQALPPLQANGEWSTAHGWTPTEPALAASRRAGSADAWVHFDGLHGRVQTTLDGVHVTTLSSPHGDAEEPSAALNADGLAAVAFTEWRSNELMLRVATHSAEGWHLTTLTRSREPIWSVHVAVTPSGSVIAAWVTVAGAYRTLQVATRTAGEPWSHPVALDHSDGLGALGVGVGNGSTVVVAWHDSVAGEQRVRAAVGAVGAWHAATTLATSLGLLDTVTVQRNGAGFVGWRRYGGPFDIDFFRAGRIAAGFGPADELARLSTARGLADRPRGAPSVRLRSSSGGRDEDSVLQRPSPR
jgi:hypothetical protein